MSIVACSVAASILLTLLPAAAPAGPRDAQPKAVRPKTAEPLDIDGLPRSRAASPRPALTSTGSATRLVRGSRSTREASPSRRAEHPAPSPIAAAR